MTPEEEQRFNFLRSGQCVPVEYVRDYYGLQWPFQNDPLHDYEAWAVRFRRREACAGGCVPRYELEAFMQQQHVVPKKWMGARLGMTVASFDLLLAHLQDIGLRPQRYIIYPQLISEALSPFRMTSSMTTRRGLSASEEERHVPKAVCPVMNSKHSCSNSMWFRRSGWAHAWG